jgi:hypothetical protein
MAKRSLSLIQKTHSLSVIAALAILIVAPSAFSQDEPDARPVKRAEERSGSTLRGENGPERRPPDARRDGRPDSEKVKRNRQMWENMSEEERELLRRKAREMKHHAERRVEQILERRGIQLTPEQRERFFQRYVEERREIERVLRERMQQEREGMEEAAIQKIQAEILEQPSN